MSSSLTRTILTTWLPVGTVATAIDLGADAVGTVLIAYYAWVPLRLGPE